MDGRLVILLVSVCVTLVSAASQIPKCGPVDIDKIKAYWNKIDGAPPKYFVDSKDTFHIVSGTNSPVMANGRCKHFSFTPPTGNQKSYIMNAIETNLKYPVSESNGVLTVYVGQTSFSGYVIAYTGDMIAAYKCSGDGPDVSSTVLADVTIAVTPQAKPADISSMTTTLKDMGFNVESFNCK